MGFRDNREFIQALEKTGDIVHIEQGVDWELEMGAITRRGCELGAPAALFERVKDYPGHRVLGAPLATYRRVAIALGLEPDTPVREIQREYGHRIGQPIPPVLVEGGPCRENIITGDEVDLFRFPTPLVHDGDGGRYIGTWAIVITKDLRSDWVNWGMYRLMIYDRNTLVGLLTPTKHVGEHLSGYSAGKQPMPVAIVIGADPVSSLVSSFTLAAGQAEVNYAGALNEQAIELVSCETNDLLVPAHAEIILEGEVLPDTLLPEGPFGEYTGYRASGMRRQNAIRIKAITHRNDPIFTMSNMGIPVHESSMRSIAKAFQYEQMLKSLGMPVTGVHIPPGFSEMVAVVGIKATQANRAVQVKDALLSQHPGSIHKIIVVDDDVDVFDLNQVLHAFATRCHPGRGVVRDEAPLTRLIPWLSPEERRLGRGPVVVFDCTWPVEWPEEETPQKIAFDTYPEEIKSKVLQSWTSYGFK